MLIVLLFSIIIFCQEEVNERRTIISVETVDDSLTSLISALSDIDVIQEIGQLDIEDEQDVMCDNNIPLYLSYGRYYQQKISEKELRGRVDHRIVRNCKFCHYPLYEVNFHHSHGFYSRSDAFSSGYGDYIVLITGLPARKQRIDSEGNEYKYLKSNYHKAVLKVFPVSSCSSDEKHLLNSIFSSSPIFIKVKDVHVNRHLGPLVMIFPLEKEHKWILDTCFYVLLEKDQTSVHNFLTKPVLVRHCHEDEGEKLKKKKDKLSVCAMIDNQDRWLVEWIEWHRMMGVSHFYLYIHQSLSMKLSKDQYYDTTASLLDSYMREGIVSLFLWNYTRDTYYWGTDQRAATNDCLWRNRDRTEYILLNDNDEFLVPYQEDNILSVLKQYEEEKDLMKNITGFTLTEFNFGEGRTNTNGHLTTNMYQNVKQVLSEYPKMIIISNNVYLTNIHNVDVAKKRQMKTYVVDPVNEGSKGLFFAHYTERKFHEYNPIVTKEEVSEEEDIFEIQWVFRRVQEFTEELEKRVEEMEGKLEVDRYRYEYHFFNPEERIENGEWQKQFISMKEKKYRNLVRTKRREREKNKSLAK